MLKLLVVGAGGFVGAVTRYWLSGAVHRFFQTPFPAGTLAVNVLGCFAIGGLICLVEDQHLFSPNARLFMMVGILGALTTFSTFGFETLELLRERSVRLALGNIAANLVFGLGAVWFGRAAAKILCT